MSNLFKNEYKVYLYKYNYSKLQEIVRDKFSSKGNAYQYLFESFITDLYSLGIPSDEIKADYLKYFNQYSDVNNTVTSGVQKQSQKSGYTVTTYKPSDTSLVDKSPDINAYRSPKTQDDNILQQALAQNYALQQLQKDYEDKQMMGEDSAIHWLNTKEDKIKYEQGLHSALEKSKDLLNELFNPVIDEIVKIRNSGNPVSEYVYCIELTDLSNMQSLSVPTTDRTKNSCDNFLNSKISNRLITDDLKTNALSNIGTIKTDLTQLTNTTSFTLRQDILLNYNIHIEPNDVIEIISTNYNKEINLKTYDEKNKDPLNRNTQFLGFVTQLSLSNKYGQVSDLTITCEGISKLLTMNPVVSDNAISPQFNNMLDFVAEPKKNPSDMTTVNVYVTQFNNSTVYELFTDIMSKVLAASPIDGDTANYTVRYVSDAEKLKGLQYQYCKPLIVLYHLAASISTVRQCGPTEVIIAKVDCNILQTKLQAYLKQLRTNFTNFWSTYASPLQILNAIVENSFLEIYEDRCGVLIMRTPRYNTWLGKDIIYMEDVIEWTQTINDVSLKSRSDYQWCIDYLGTMSNFPGNAYENIPALLKYGFRAEQPKTSPNAKNQRLCAVFGALDVARSNSRTRVIRLTVPMIEDYVLGKLYYLPIQEKNGVDGLDSVGCVGYLSSITSNISPGDVDKHILEFTYIRNAELLEEDPSIPGNYGKILNFNHLPDLEMMMNSFTEKDFEPPVKPKTESQKSNPGLPAQYSRYWAAYKGPYKKIFDNYSAGSSIDLISKEERSYFDMSMAPTVLTRSSFQSYVDNNKNKILNTAYVPSQQLVNDIWYIDMCLRYNEHIGNDIVKFAKHNSYWAKILRSKKYQQDFLSYLKRDKTFDQVSLQEFIPLNINNKITLEDCYANIENYFINESLVPSMLQPINQDGDDTQIDRLNHFMEEYVNAYNFLQSNSHINKVNFIRTYGKETGNDGEPYNEFNIVSDKLKEIITEFDIFKNDEYNFINLYSKLYKNLNNTSPTLKYVRGMFKEYYKANTDIWQAAYKQILFYKQANDFQNFDFEMLNNYLNFKGVYTSKKSKKNPIQHLISAVALSNKPFPPLRIFNNYDYGAFLAAVSPVDYKPFFKEKITPILKTNILNKTITLQDNSFRNSKNEVIGTITDFVFDSTLSDDVNLYFYPVIKFNSNISKDEAAKYITSKVDLQSFAAGGVPGKRLPSVIVIAPTQIPESKIPTIQQMALNKGLYVGKVDDGSVSIIGDDLNVRAAIFNPSVLYTWKKSELNNTYTATIYNLMSNLNNNKLKTFTQKNDLNSWSRVIDFGPLLKDYLKDLPCVFNTKLNFNKYSNNTFDLTKSVQESIENIFNDIQRVNSKNSFFRVKKLGESNYYQLQDESDSLEDGHTANTDKSIILNFTNDNGDLEQIVEKYKAPNNVIEASVGTNDKIVSDSFASYVKSREEVHLGLYTRNEQNSTIFYKNVDKYPTRVRSNAGKITDEA